MTPVVGDDMLEVVPEFRSLNDMLSAGGGCELAAVTCGNCEWSGPANLSLFSPIAICC